MKETVQVDVGEALAIVEYGFNECKLTKLADAVEMEYQSKFGDIPADKKAEIAASKAAKLKELVDKAASKEGMPEALCVVLPMQQPALFAE